MLLQRNTLAHHKATVTQLLRFGDIIMSLDEDNTLCTWNLQTNGTNSRTIAIKFFINVSCL